MKGGVKKRERRTKTRERSRKNGRYGGRKEGKERDRKMERYGIISKISPAPCGPPHSAEIFPPWSPPPPHAHHHHDHIICPKPELYN